jgi:pimeloyl-ACP methyl ester carboxylesterase
MWPLGCAEARDLRIISVDRPGLGGSQPQPGRQILDWAADVRTLADALGLQRFRVLGYSGGVPYALACAQLLPDRIIAAAVVACVGPDSQPGLVAGLPPSVARIRRTSRRWPWLARLTWVSVRVALRRYPQRVLDQTMAALPEPDRNALGETRVADAYLAALGEALRPGTAGATRDMALMARPWRLQPERIAVPIQIWQGEQDRNAPPIMARELADRITASTIHWHPNDGHLSIVTSHGGEILTALSGDAGRDAGDRQAKTPVGDHVSSPSERGTPHPR